MEIAAFFASAGAIAKCLKEANRIDLLEQLTEVRAAVVELQNQVLDKDEEIKRLRDTVRLRKNLVFVAGALWEFDETGQRFLPEPYCSRCLERDGYTIHMQYWQGKFHCPECKTSVPGGAGPPEVERRHVD